MKPALRIALAVLFAIAVAGLALWPPARNWMLIQVGAADRENGALTLYGNVDIREVELAFRQSGRLVSMAYDEGDRVQVGSLVAELDAQPYRDSLAAAEAEVRRRRAELDKLNTGNRPQEIAEAEADVRKAEATLRNAENDFKRKSALQTTSAASVSALDAAHAARDEARAALASRRQALALMKEGARQEDKAAAEAALAAAQASLAQAQTALDDTRLLSPADAVVLSRVREPGSMVGPDAPVYTLSLRDPVYVRAYVAEPDLGRVVPGTPVRLRTDSSAKEYNGKVGFVSPRAEFTPKSVETTALRTDLVYRLRIVVSDADDGLRQGMPVTVMVDAPPKGK